MNVNFTFVIVMKLEDLLRWRHISNRWQIKEKILSSASLSICPTVTLMWILLTKDRQCATSVPCYNVIMLVDDRFSANTGSVNGLVPLDNKPLPEPMFPRCLSTSLADKAKMKLTELNRVIPIQSFVNPITMQYIWKTDTSRWNLMLSGPVTIWKTHPKYVSNSDLAKSRLFNAFFSVKKSFCNFAPSKTVILSCVVQ